MGSSRLGRYRLLAELGSGGMAEVWLAATEGAAPEIGAEKLLVVKRMRKHLAFDPSFVTMFHDEARLSVRLDHPNVVQTLEAGTADDEAPFLVLEFMDGQPLNRIQLKGQADHPRLRDLLSLVIVDVLAGLHYAHELCDYDGTFFGLVHRDVSPHNVMVTYRGQVKVMDFGIAKIAHRATQTTEGTFKGKIQYIAPEQALAVGLDRRADVFAVGIMLWEIATGRRFWGDRTEPQVLNELLSGTYARSARAVDPTVDATLDAIVSRALARMPEERFATAQDFGRALEDYLATRVPLHELRRELGLAVAEMFATERVNVQKLIDGNLRKAREASRSGHSIEVPPPASPEGPAPSSESQRSGATATVPALPSTSQLTPSGTPPPRSATIPASARPPSKASRLMPAAIAAVVLALAIPFTAYLARGRPAAPLEAVSASGSAHPPPATEVADDAPRASDPTSSASALAPPEATAVASSRHAPGTGPRLPERVPSGAKTTTRPTTSEPPAAGSAKPTNVRSLDRSFPWEKDPE